MSTETTTTITSSTISTTRSSSSSSSYSSYSRSYSYPYNYSSSSSINYAYQTNNVYTISLSFDAGRILVYIVWFSILMGVILLFTAPFIWYYRRRKSKKKAEELANEESQQKEPLQKEIENEGFTENNEKLLKEPDYLDLKQIAKETKIDKLLEYRGDGKDILNFTFAVLNQELGVTKEEYERIGTYKKKYSIREEPDLETKESKGNSKGKTKGKGKGKKEGSESQISLPNMPKESQLNHDDLKKDKEGTSLTSNYNETSNNDTKSKELEERNSSEVENTRNEPSINSPKSKKHLITSQIGNTSILNNTNTEKNETNQIDEFANIDSQTNFNEQ